jgi:hypothetical protein
LSWRWRIDILIADADEKSKSGDDYPIRIFVMFDDDSAETSFWTSIRNSATLAVMSDTDNTGNNTESCFNYIRIYTD